MNKLVAVIFLLCGLLLAFMPKESKCYGDRSEEDIQKIKRFGQYLAFLGVCLTGLALL